MPRKPTTLARIKRQHNGDGARALYDARRGTAASRGYDARWRKARAAYLKRHPICVVCLSMSRTRAAQEVHHIIPLREGGTHAEANLQALCKSCHSRITGQGVGGYDSGT